jgi:hypothetical protein
MVKGLQQISVTAISLNILNGISVISNSRPSHQYYLWQEIRKHKVRMASSCMMYIDSKLHGNMSNVRFEVFRAVTMKNAVFWDINTQSVLHRRQVTSPLQSPTG